VMFVYLDGRPGCAITAAHRFVGFAVGFDNIFEVFAPMWVLRLVARENIGEVFREERVNIRTVLQVKFIGQALAEFGTGAADDIDITPRKLAERRTVAFAG